MDKPLSATGAAAGRLPAAWQRLLPLWLLLTVLLLAVYRETAWGMVQIWSRSETFAHAYLVPPITAWLIWRARARWLALTPRLWGWPLLGLALAGALWLAGDLSGLNALTQFALVAQWVCLSLALLGPAVGRVMAFPLLFVFFAVPMGEALVPLLMDGTADFTIAALRASGVPVYREGLNFVIPSGHWSVVEACSGIRYLIASLMVGSLFAYLSYRGARKRWLFMLVAALLPLVANWLRAYMIVMLAHLSGNELATGVDHLIYGWVFFGLVMFAMFVIGSRWADPVEPAVAAPITAVASPLPQRGAALAGGALACAVLVLLPLLLRPASPEVATQGLTLALSERVGAWARQADDASRWSPNYAQADLRQAARWQRGDEAPPVFSDLAYYAAQDYQRKMLSSTQGLLVLGESQWRLLEPRRVDAGGTAMQQFVLEGGAVVEVARTRALVRQVYWVGGRWTERALEARAWVMLNKLLRRGDDSAVLVLHTPLRDGDRGEEAGARLQAWWTEARPALEQALQGLHRQARGSGS